jgi:hypothetical protein
MAGQGFEQAIGLLGHWRSPFSEPPPSSTIRLSRLTRAKEDPAYIVAHSIRYENQTHALYHNDISCHIWTRRAKLGLQGQSNITCLCETRGEVSHQHRNPGCPAAG